MLHIEGGVPSVQNAEKMLKYVFLGFFFFFFAAFYSALILQICCRSILQSNKHKSGGGKTTSGKSACIFHFSFFYSRFPC